MQRPSTKQSRGANAEEKRHMQWIKERGVCVACENDGGVICHHAVGSSYKVRVGLEIVLIGHALVLGLCQCCDNMVTNGSHKAFKLAFDTYTNLFFKQYAESPVKFDDLIIQGIAESGK